MPIFSIWYREVSQIWNFSKIFDFHIIWKPLMRRFQNGLIFQIGAGYSRKKQRRGLRIYFAEIPPGNFKFVTLLLEIPEKKSFHPWKFSKILWHTLEIPRSKNKTHEIPRVFAWTAFCFFFNWPLEFQHFLSSIPLEIPFPQLPCLDFFWNSPFGKVVPEIFQYVNFSTPKRGF